MLAELPCFRNWSVTPIFCTAVWPQGPWKAVVLLKRSLHSEEENLQKQAGRQEKLKKYPGLDRKASSEDQQTLGGDRVLNGRPDGSHCLINTWYYYYKTNTMINHKRSHRSKTLNEQLWKASQNCFGLLMYLAIKSFHIHICFLAEEVKQWSGC